MGFSRVCALGALLLVQAIADSADYDAYATQYADRKTEDSADEQRRAPAISGTEEAQRAKEEPAAKERRRPEAHGPVAADPAAAGRDAYARAEDGIAKLRGLGEEMKANLHSKTFADAVAQGLRTKVRADFDSQRRDLNRHFDRALEGVDPESLATVNASEVERAVDAPKAILKQLKDLNKAQSREMRGALHDLSKAGKEKVKGLWKEAKLAAKQVHHSGMAAARAQRAAGVQEGVYERNEGRSEEASGRLTGRAEEAAERAEGLLERQSGEVEHRLERMMDEDGDAEGRALDALRERLHQALHRVEEARKDAKAKAAQGAPTLLLSRGSASDRSGAPATKSAAGGYDGDSYSKQYAGNYTKGPRNGKFADYVERFAKDYSSYSRGPAKDYSTDRLADAKAYEEQYAGDYERKYAPQGRQGREYMDQYTQEPKQKAQQPASERERASDAKESRQRRQEHPRYASTGGRKDAKAKAAQGAPTLLLSRGSASDRSGAPATQSAAGGYDGNSYSKQYAGNYTKGPRNGKFADYVERYAKDYSSYSRGPAKDYSRDRLAEAKDYEDRYAGDYERKYSSQGRQGREYMDQYTQEKKQKAQQPASERERASDAKESKPKQKAQQPASEREPAGDAKEPRPRRQERPRDASTKLTELGAAIQLAEDAPAEEAAPSDDGHEAAPSDHEHEAAPAKTGREAAPPRHEHEAKPAEPAQEAKPAEPARATRDPVEEAQAAMRDASAQAEARIAKLRSWNSDMEDQLHRHSFALTVAQGIQARVRADFDAQRRELNGRFDRALEVLGSKTMATAASSEVEKAVDNTKAVITQLKLLGRAESKEMHRAMRALGKSGKAKARSLWREARVAAKQVYHSGMAASRAQHKAGARERVYERSEGRTEKASERLRQHAERAAEGAERNVERQTDQVEHRLEKMMDEASDKQSETLDALRERLRHARERLEEARRAAKEGAAEGEKANASGPPAVLFLAGDAWQDVRDLSSTLAAPFTCVAMIAAVTLLLVGRRWRRAAIIEQPLLA